MTTGKKIKKNLSKVTVGKILAFLIFAFFAGTLVYSLIWAVVSSLKDPVEYIVDKNTFFPQKWLFGNYIEAFELLNVKGHNVFEMFFNSIWLTLGKSLISAAVCTTTAYIMSKYEFVGKKVMNAVILASMMIPLYGSQAATLKLYLKTGMYNSPLILLASASGVGSMFLILRSYFKGVSWEYAEAAQLDGASDLWIYLKVMLPLAKPAVMSLFMVMLIGGWNDWETSVYYLPDYPTVASGLYLYEKISSFNINFPVYFGGVVMASIPTMILFLCFQEQIMNSITTGGLKG